MYAETLFLPHTDVKPDTRCVPKTREHYSEMKKNTSFMLQLYFFVCIRFLLVISACGGTGRRCRLKICCPQGRASSSLARRTNC